MIVATVTITGAKETAVKLDALDKKVRRKVVNKAVRAGAKVIATRAKANAPRKTGFMARKITVRASKYIGNRRKKRGEIAINAQIGQGNFKGKAFYGGQQEFGFKTGKRGDETMRPVRFADGTWRLIKSKTPYRRKQIEGKHFMERAGKQGESEAVGVIMTTIRQGIEEAAKS